MGEVEEKLAKKEKAKEFILGELAEQSGLSAEEIITKAKEIGIGKTAVEDALKEMRTEKLVLANTMPGKGKKLFYSLPVVNEDIKV